MSQRTHGIFLSRLALFHWRLSQFHSSDYKWQNFMSFTLQKIPLCTLMHHILLIYSPIDKRVADSTSPTLWIILQWAERCSCLFHTLILFPVNIRALAWHGNRDYNRTWKELEKTAGGLWHKEKGEVMGMLTAQCELFPHALAEILQWAAPGFMYYLSPNYKDD